MSSWSPEHWRVALPSLMTTNQDSSLHRRMTDVDCKKDSVARSGFWRPNRAASFGRHGCSNHESCCESEAARRERGEEKKVLSWLMPLPPQLSKKMTMLVTAQALKYYSILQLQFWILSSLSIILKNNKKIIKIKIIFLLIILFHGRKRHIIYKEILKNKLKIYISSMVQK